jgi:hypothetical protein
LSLDEACFGPRRDVDGKPDRAPGAREALTVPHPAPGLPHCPHYHFSPGDQLDVSGNVATVVSWDPANDRLEVVYGNAG